MGFLRNRFLIAVTIITAAIVSGMGVAHLAMDRRQSLEPGHSEFSPVLPKAEGYPSPTQFPSSKGPFRVVRVLDGDTIVLDNGETVRLIGVDAPETIHPKIPVQRFGVEATDFLRRLVEGSECTLEYEPGNIRDKYGRLLAYVFVRDRLANAELIRQGYAYAYIRFPFRRQSEFVALEREARERQCGLWYRSAPESPRLPDKVPVVFWQDAAKHYGEYAAVEGTIVATYNSGKACFLNFHKDYSRFFTAVIFASDFSRFSVTPESYYLGKKVRVSGYIKEYRGKPEIVLEYPDQIEIL